MYIFSLATIMLLVVASSSMSATMESSRYDASLPIFEKMFSPLEHGRYGAAVPPYEKLFSPKLSQLGDEQRLFNHLINGYQRAVRPVHNASTPVQVKLGLSLINILDLDERNQILTTKMWLQMEWTDEMLRWDPKNYENQSSISLPCDLVWLPDIELYNSADAAPESTSKLMRSRVVINNLGNVVWVPRANFRGTCQKIDESTGEETDRYTKLWKCTLKFGSWTYNGFQVDIVNRGDTIGIDDLIKSKQFELVQTELTRQLITYACCPEPYPTITGNIVLRK